MEKEVIELEGKKVVITPAPATVGYEVALKYFGAIEGKDPKVLQECLYELLKFCELDLGDGRLVKLDNKTLIDQHFKQPHSLIQLQKITAKVNFGFLVKDTPSDS